MGLVSALRRHIESFSKETGVRLKAHLPKKTHLPVEINICLFRITQEALMSVYKHADIQTARICTGNSE